MNILDFEEAIAEARLRASGMRDQHRLSVIERVSLLEAAGRVLAVPVLADRDQPPFNRSTRDGFAVRAEAFSSDRPLNILGQLAAGQIWTGQSLPPYGAIEIMTGAPMPDGANAVAMIEHVQILGATIKALVGRNLNNGENVVPRGSEATMGEIILAAGGRIGPSQIAAAAACGMSELDVFGRPTVAIVSTGDELIEIAQIPERQQIRNSNSYALAALVKTAGAEAQRLFIARDTREQLLERIAEGRVSDLILFSGGVSMGKYDLVEEVLAELGAEFFFTGVRIQPGKPVVFGRLPAIAGSNGGSPECYFFGLPGNPVSTQVTFHCFVEPFLRLLGGCSSNTPEFLQATLARNVDGKPELTRLLPANCSHNLHAPSVELTPWQGSGDLTANARANCYAVLPPRQGLFPKGEVITVLLR